ncbi:MAG: hypothetical protein HONBIEJF_02076 [Fimbriimonadaceae bacterium]|nr:hypothetical protein [Fimbriimonadaceae bacterium]
MDAFLQSIAEHWRPHPGQREFLVHPSPIKVLACGRRWGKTDVCAVETLYRLTRSNGHRCVVIAPTQDQANILFDRVVALARTVLGPKRVENVRSSPYPRLEIGGNELTARSGHLEYTLRGREASSIVIDEAAFLPESVITEVAMPMLATNDGTMTLISTPNGLNHFHRFFDLGQRGEHGIWSRTGPSEESPLVSRRFLGIQQELISPRAYRVEYEASFEDSAGRVFKTEDIDACLFETLPPIEGRAAVGIDLGRDFDFTAVVVVVGKREGFAVHRVDRWHRVCWDTTVSRIADLVEPYPDASVIVDATGVGNPVFELMEQRPELRAARGLQFTNAVKQELIQNLSWAFERRHLAMTPHIELIKELQHFEQTTTDAGNTRYNARNGYHDDLVIALALAVSGLGSAITGRILLGDLRK